ncbi:MAG: hypothetical protein K0R88_1197 [Solirubrobacterales bacterium]|nr:hypothetical protein [Solirubrobacterales bacterium]
MRRIRIAAVAVMVTAGVSLGSGSVAGAAKPANQGCVGESLSALATNQPSPGAFGAAVVSFAQDPSGRPGLGDTVQAGQAGLIPDAVLPNTCND